MDQDKSNDIEFEAGLSAHSGLSHGLTRSTHYTIDCVRDGKVIWTEEFDNIVVNAGLDDSLDKHFKGSGYTAAWYVGIGNLTGAFAAGDVMSSHSGWAEVTAYDEAARQTLTLGSVSGQSVNNSASKAVFTISGTVTVNMAFIVTVSTKGGTTGILYGEGQFSQSRSLVDNDVLNVTITLTAATA